MKKTMLMAMVLVLAGCGEKKAETMPADTAAMAPATEMSDTGMGMSHDNMTSDSTMARDTTSK